MPSGQGHLERTEASTRRNNTRRGIIEARSNEQCVPPVVRIRGTPTPQGGRAPASGTGRKPCPHRPRPVGRVPTRCSPPSLPSAQPEKGTPLPDKSRGTAGPKTILAEAATRFGKNFPSFSLLPTVVGDPQRVFRVRRMVRFGSFTIFRGWLTVYRAKPSIPLSLPTPVGSRSKVMPCLPSPISHPSTAPRTRTTTLEPLPMIVPNSAATGKKRTALGQNLPDMGQKLPLSRLHKAGKRAEEGFDVLACRPVRLLTPEHQSIGDGGVLCRLLRRHIDVKSRGGALLPAAMCIPQPERQVFHDPTFH